MNPLTIGIIGTDTSHAVIFTQLINDINHPYYLKDSNAKVVAAFAGGSADFPLSYSRVEGFMEKITTPYGVSRMDTLEEVASICDVILLESADGRVHADQFRQFAAFRKPVFIDKPLALSSKDALEIHRIAAEYQIPIMSSSALRYAEELTMNLDRKGHADVRGADVYGPLIIEPTQSYYFWYGIHSVEMLYAVMGVGCVQVKVVVSEEYDLITGEWEDGRIGTVKCMHGGDSDFGATIHRRDGSSVVSIQKGAKPFYASLLEQIIVFFHNRQSPIDWNETLEIILFLEAAESSRVLDTVIKLGK